MKECIDHLDNKKIIFKEAIYQHYNTKEYRNGSLVLTI